MPKANLNQHSKRQRELAKKDKRAAKDDKRAQRKANDRDARVASTPAAKSVGGAAPKPAAAPSPTSVAAAAFIKRMNIRS